MEAAECFASFQHVVYSLTQRRAFRAGIFMLFQPQPQFVDNGPGVTLLPLVDLFCRAMLDPLFQPVQPGDLSDRHRRTRIFIRFIQIGEATPGVGPASSQRDPRSVLCQCFIGFITISNQRATPQEDFSSSWTY